MNLNLLYSNIYYNLLEVEEQLTLLLLSTYYTYYI